VNRPATVREALIAEAIGEVAGLIERLEAVAPALDASRQALVQAGEEVAGQVVALENRMAGITENAKVQATRHIARRTEEIARSSLETQTRAMEEAARSLFRSEVCPALQRLVAPFQQLADMGTRPLERWLTHAATAAVASSLTWAMAAWLWAR
jgi:hypothetical protein